MGKAVLVLQDGTVMEGESFGAQADAVFELVFNTSMTGYQEILTDPSYRGQGVLFTVPHIGNVGINLEDYEAPVPQISGVIVRSLSPIVSNWRAVQPLSNWLNQSGVPGISGVDTRYLTRKLRDSGTMKAGLSTHETPIRELLNRVEEWPGLDGFDMVKDVTCPESYHWDDDLAHHWVAEDVVGFDLPKWQKQPVVVLFDYGAKRNIPRHLVEWGAHVIVVPASTSAKEALSLKPDGVLLSNGPGDPAGLPYAVENIMKLIEFNIPLFGICLGHQLIGLALGGQTARLKFGHHGGNHPVQDLRSLKTLVTSQNHNYHVVIKSLDPNQVETTHISLNDGSMEGFRLRDRPVFSVQFHPEGAPGPHDAHGLFGEFFKMIEANRRL